MELAAIIIIATLVTLTVGRIAWEHFTGRPVSGGDSVGGWFGSEDFTR